MQKTSKTRILIVDDEDSLREILRIELSRSGYETASAPDGEQAVSILGKNKFDLILLDIKLPKMDGIAVLKYAHQKYPKTKIIMMTGFGDLKNAMESKEHGAIDFITKPFNINDVVGTIKTVLSE